MDSVDSITLLYGSSLLQVPHMIKLKVVQIYNNSKDPYFIWFIFLDMFTITAKCKFFLPIIGEKFEEISLFLKLFIKTSDNKV
jgi:hypothetical protein